MEYTLSTTALPVLYFETKGVSVVGKPYALNSNKITALHYHKTAELGICLSGKGITYIGNKIYNFKTGDIQVLPPLVPHLSTSNEGEKSTWIWITFDPVSLLKNAGLTSPDGALSLAVEDNFLTGVFSENEYPELTKSILDIIASSKTEDEFYFLSVTLAIARFLIVSSRIKKTHSHDTPHKNKSSSRQFHKIAPAIDFIGANLDDSDALKEENLAKKCGVSVPTLRRLFSLHTGYSPKVFIVRSRMAYAEYLLRESSLSVLDVSLYCGYSEVSGFNRTFKSFFGTSPLSYRKEK